MVVWSLALELRMPSKVIGTDSPSPEFRPSSGRPLSSAVECPCMKGVRFIAAWLVVCIWIGPAAAAKPVGVGDGGTIACPENTVLEERQKNEGRVAWCHTGDGTAHGPAAAWHPDGGRRNETHWLQGRKHGRDLSWDESGVRREEANWVDGRLHGTSTSWNAAGGRERETDYAYGKREGRVVVWDDAGTQILEGRFAKGLKHGIWSFRGPRERSSEAAFAVMIDDEDLTQGLLESPPIACAQWSGEPPMRRRGYLAVMALLSLRAATESEHPDEFPIALCIADESRPAALRLDEACNSAASDFLDAVKRATVELALSCSP